MIDLAQNINNEMKDAEKKKLNEQIQEEIDFQKRQVKKLFKLRVNQNFIKKTEKDKTDEK